MYGTSQFQSSRRGYGADAAAATATTPSTKGLTDPAASTKGMTESQINELISGGFSVLKDVGTTAIETIGGIEVAKITGQAPTRTTPGTGFRAAGGLGPRQTMQQVSGGGSTEGSEGITGTHIAIGAGVLVAVGVGAYFLLRKPAQA